MARSTTMRGGPRLDLPSTDGFASPSPPAESSSPTVAGSASTSVSEAHLGDSDDLVELLVAVARETAINYRTDPCVDAFRRQYGKAAEAAEQLLAGRTTWQSFTPLAQLLTTGHVSSLFLASHKDHPGSAFVVKRMSKQMVLSRALQDVCYREERDLLVLANRERLRGSKACEGIVQLRYAFHDVGSLYLATDFCPGGDLLALLEKHEVFSEQWVRFYVAEVVQALAAVHALGFVHRDISAENIVLNHRGHAVLTDFGACARLEGGVVPPDRALLLGAPPDYISPELLQVIQGEKLATYGAETDWWSLGVLIYELLYGDPCFYDDSTSVIYRRIADHKRHLVFDDDVPISKEARDLITQLLQSKATRLGSANGAADIMAHPFFHGVMWDELRDTRPPFVPELASPLDTNFFETTPVHALDTAPPPAPPVGSTPFTSALAFLGYYYTCPDLPVERDPQTPVKETPKRGGKGSSRRRVSDGAHRNVTYRATHAARPELSTPSPELMRRIALRDRDRDRTPELPLLPSPSPAPSPCIITAPKSCLVQPRASAVGGTPAASASGTRRRRILFSNESVFFDSAANGDHSVLACMLKEGLVKDVDARTGTGLSAVALAAMHGHCGALSVLLDAGAQINAQADDGCTPLILAIVDEHQACVELLVARGADETLVTAAGETAADVAADLPLIKACLNIALTSRRRSTTRN